jgi:hypothetical protein
MRIMAIPLLFALQSETGPWVKGSVAGELLYVLGIEAGIVPVGTVVPKNIIIRLDAGRLTQRPGRDNQFATFQTGVGYQ